MKNLLALLFSVAVAYPSTPATVDVVIVVGAPGEPTYGEMFSDSVRDWTAACEAAKKTFKLIQSKAGETNQLSELRDSISAQGNGDRELWLILIGHGTFDGKDAKLNLNGPDISAREMSELLAPVQRPLVLINSTSASAPFINSLSSTNRIIVTATKSGYEENFARFGMYIGKAIVDPLSDVDKDGQVSVLEAFLGASRMVEEFHMSEKRLATEHALLDDNGDAKGTPATFFSGVRPAKKPSEAVNLDGFRAHQLHFLPNEEEARLSPAVRKRRNELELDLERARVRKPDMLEADYLNLIEPIILELSRLYRDARPAEAAETKPASPE